METQPVLFRKNAQKDEITIAFILFYNGKTIAFILFYNGKTSNRTQCAMALFN